MNEGIIFISPFRANLDAQLDNFQPNNLTAPDFLVEFPRGSGTWRELEVKSNQTYWNASYFRMLIPAHWNSYGRADAIVLWASCDLGLGCVNVHGFNFASSDAPAPNVIARKTCVHNF
jgi:hypothetical protein